MTVRSLVDIEVVETRSGRYEVGHSSDRGWTALFNCDTLQEAEVISRALGLFPVSMGITSFAMTAIQAIQRRHDRADVELERASSGQLGGAATEAGPEDPSELDLGARETQCPACGSFRTRPHVLGVGADLVEIIGTECFDCAYRTVGVTVGETL